MNRISLKLRGSSYPWIFFFLLSCSFATVSSLLALRPRIKSSIFPYYSVSFSEEVVHKEGGAFSFYLFSRVDGLRIRFSVDDRADSLKAFQITLNGRNAGFVDAGGRVSEAGARGGFEGDEGPWLRFPELGRRGLNSLRIAPLYSLTKRQRRNRRLIDWSTKIFFQRAVRFEPALIFKGLRDMLSVEEELYFHLKRFDELLRSLPRACFPRAFVRDARSLPHRLRRASRRLRARNFIEMANDFYRFNYGKSLGIFSLFEAMIAGLQEIEWIWQEPSSHPLAAHIYGSNERRVFFQEYLHDVVLAKRKSKNAYLVFCSSDLAEVDTAALRSLLKAQREEKSRLSNLFEVSSFVRLACKERANAIYSDFPHWRSIFEQSFARRVRARFWPSALYPRRMDLFRERVLLREYCRLIRRLARSDLQQAKFRISILKAIIDAPREKTATPVVKPFHPEEGP